MGGTGGGAVAGAWVSGPGVTGPDVSGGSVCGDPVGFGGTTPLFIISTIFSLYGLPLITLF